MKYYCIGIKGSGMSTLAQILNDLGNEVCGYDDVKDYKFTQEGLDKRNIKIYYDDSFIVEKDTIVTYSVAFSDKHPELVRMRKMGANIVSYHEVMGSLTKQFKTISVCGTHGKTTTSLLISHVFQNTIGCNYFVGDGQGFAVPDNKLFVMESDEFNRHFLAYYPEDVLLTNIELDHTEIYKDIDDLIATFNKFANKTKRLLVMCGDDSNIRKLDINNNIKKVYYGFNEDNDVVARNIKLTSVGSEFDVYMDNKFYGHFELPLYGKHMILNALGSIVILDSYNISLDDITKYLSDFEGAKRRFKVEEFEKIVTIDDYAHHPTEISVTIDSARQKYPEKEVVAVFLPNTYSRTQDLMDDFAKALSKADKAYVMDIHCDREKQSDYPGVSSDKLIELIPGAEKVSLDTVSKLLKHDNSVICFMSCTNIYEILNKFKELLNK